MKMSEAILKGMERFPRNAIGMFQNGQNAACVMGCANWAITGYAEIWHSPWADIAEEFEYQYGVHPADLSNAHVPRDVIAGMFAAIGE